MNKIIITGPESSGKTTLSKQISKYFKIPLVKEYARTYIQELNRKYTESDLIKIAHKQYELETKKNTPLICDTDLITIKIWSEYRYKKCDNWILEKIKSQQQENRTYFLCSPDIIWKQDPQRENPDNREELFTIYKKVLDSLKYNYYIIKGEERFDQCVNKIKKLII